MSTHTIFYSWQYDLPTSINRRFIEDCLERAITELHSDAELSLDPCLDRDTSGTPESPNIAAMIFGKIRRADVFVGDVTFIDNGNKKCGLPNPNILVELGYAAACLGWERILCVFNEAFGRVDGLPFDIRSRRVREYSLTRDQGQAGVREALVRALRSDIEDILCNPKYEGSSLRSNQGCSERH